MKRSKKVDGPKLREIREEKWLNQVDVAAKAGVTDATIRRIERMETPYPRRETLLAIAKALGVHPNDLLVHPPKAESDSLRGGLETRPWREFENETYLRTG